jgi:adenosylcobinamide-GDP ribazoletransferase
VNDAGDPTGGSATPDPAARPARPADPPAAGPGSGEHAGHTPDGGNDGGNDDGDDGGDAPVTLAEALRFAFGTLTALPVRLDRWDRAVAGRGMACAPVVGAVAGGLGGLAGAVLALFGAGAGVSAVAAVAAGAVLTRGLHLDGLADVADGLGSGRPPAEALRIMKRSDIGPFGVVTLVLVLLAQTAALGELYGTEWTYGLAGAVLAGVTGRAAMALACRAGVPAARPEGLGAAVAGTLTRRAAALVLAATVVAGALLGALPAAGPLGTPLGWPLGAAAALAGPLAAEALLRHCRKRFGGTTGDVFGALCETAATAALVVLTFG